MDTRANGIMPEIEPIELKPAYEIFAQHIARGFAPMESAAKARYKDRNASARLLKIKEVQGRVKQIQAEITAKIDDRPIIDSKGVLRELTESALAHQGIETTKGYTIQIGDKLKSLELMGRHYKLFADKLVIEADMGSAPPDELDRATQRSRERLRKHIESRAITGTGTISSNDSTDS